MGISSLTSYKHFPPIYSELNLSLCQNQLRFFTFTLSAVIHLSTEIQTKVKNLILDLFFVSVHMTSGHQILLFLPPTCQSCPFFLSHHLWPGLSASHPDFIVTHIQYYSIHFTFCNFYFKKIVYLAAVGLIAAHGIFNIHCSRQNL